MSRLNSSVFAMHAHARGRFDLVLTRPGETFIVVERTKDAPPTPVEREATEASPE